jgi:hypothetical protein
MRNDRTEARAASWPYQASHSSRSLIRFAEPVPVASSDRQAPREARFANVWHIFAIGVGLAATIAWIAVLAWLLSRSVLGAARLIF